jgi:pSer/pThr/pTyr-binding forkhead associated (FHA) protein
MDVKLIMFKTDGQPKAIPITKPLTVLGRGLDCDLRIPIESCSRKQCQLAVRGGQLRVKDLESSNGTYVNNARITEAVLNAGDKLTIGPITMMVQIDGMPREIQDSALGAGVPDRGELIPTEETSDDPFAELAAAAGGGGGPGDTKDPLSALESLSELQQEDNQEN